jgi:cytochrome P450
MLAAPREVAVDAISRDGATGAEEGARRIDVGAFDPHQPAFADDPYPFYAALRREAPVHYVPSIREWWVTRYRDVRAMLDDRRLGRRLPSEESGPPPLPIAALGGAPRPPSLLRLEPPDHTRLRGLVNRAFTPRVVADLRPRIEAITAELLDRAAARGRLDLVADLAAPLPAIVIAEMLGVPPADRERFKAWSSDLIYALDATQPPALRLRAREAGRELIEYFAGLVAERERQPRSDMITELLAAEEQGDRLDRGELLSMLALLLVAGHETTTNLIASGLFCLLRHPEQRRRLVEQPELLPGAVEEVLRFEAPIQRARHATREPTEIGGTLVPAGQTVTAVIGSANRDEEAFAEPDRFDVARAENQHLAFGRGPHFCLGAPLARLEGQIAFAAVLDRFPGLELERVDPEWSGNTTVRALKSAPARV